MRNVVGQALKCLKPPELPPPQNLCHHQQLKSEQVKRGAIHTKQTVTKPGNTWVCVCGGGGGGGGGEEGRGGKAQPCSEDLKGQGGDMGGQGGASGRWNHLFAITTQKAEGEKAALTLKEVKTRRHTHRRKLGGGVGGGGGREGKREGQHLFVFPTQSQEN